MLTAVYDACTIARIDVIRHDYVHFRLYWAIHIRYYLEARRNICGRNIVHAFTNGRAINYSTSIPCLMGNNLLSHSWESIINDIHLSEQIGQRLLLEHCTICPLESIQSC